MLKIGIIGAIDTVDVILQVAEEFASQAEFKAYKYIDKAETVALTQQSQEECDILLFSGQSPYMQCYLAGILSKRAVYIPRTGTSLYKSFWQIREDGIDLKRLSADALPEKEIVEAADELGIALQGVFINTLDFTKNFSNQDLMAYHLDLWKAGKIDAAITGFTKVYEILRAQGVAVYKMYPTKALIREYITKVLLLGEVSHVKKMQTAVQVVRLRILNDRNLTKYDFHTIRNELESTLIAYTKENLGSLFPSGKDEYLIFTNRGAIEPIYGFGSFKKDWTKGQRESVVLSSGIGYGANVHEAEVNARMALDHAMSKPVDCSFMLDERGNVTGPLTADNQMVLTYDMAAGRDANVRDISEKASISATYISKLKALIEKLGRSELDSHDVSSMLGISDRTARRILGGLVNAGYGEVIHTQSKARTGRPRKIYKINL